MPSLTVHNENLQYFQVPTQEKETQWEDPSTLDHTYVVPLKLGFPRASMVAEKSADDIQFYTGVSVDSFRR